MFPPFVRSLRSFGLVKPILKLFQQNSSVHKTALFSCSAFKNVACKNPSENNPSIGGGKKGPLFKSSPVQDLLKQLIETTSFTQRTLLDSIPPKKTLTEAGFKKLYDRFSLQLEGLIESGKDNSDIEILDDVKKILVESAVHKTIPYLISSSACS